MIEWMDNFSQYGTNEDYMLDGLYASRTGTVLAADPDGVSGGKVLQIWGSSLSNQGAIRKVRPSSRADIGIAFRLYMAELPEETGSEPYILRLRDVDNVTQLSLKIKNTGAIEVWRGTGTTKLGGTTFPVMVAGGWHHFEWKAVISQTVGEYELRVNEETILTGSSLDTCATSNEECSQYEFNNGPGTSLITSGLYIKDLITWNTSGTENVDFVGDCQVLTLLPVGDDSFNWTPSTGTTGYPLIDETDPNDADYISADSTPPAASVFTLSDLDPDVTTVKGLMTFVRASKTDAGTAKIQVGLVSGASTDEGIEHTVMTDEVYFTDVSELDPATGSAWTPSAVDAAKLKINRTV